MAIRVAVTGRTATPPLFDTLVALGRDRALARIDRAIERSWPADPGQRTRPRNALRVQGQQESLAVGVDDVVVRRREERVECLHRPWAVVWVRPGDRSRPCPRRSGSCRPTRCPGTPRARPATWACRVIRVEDDHRPLARCLAPDVRHDRGSVDEPSRYVIRGCTGRPSAGIDVDRHDPSVTEEVEDRGDVIRAATVSRPALDDEVGSVSTRISW